MTSEPTRKPAAPSGVRGMTMHQRMEDARARRAEAMALKQPANDDARVSDQKPPSKPQPEQKPETTPAFAPPITETKTAEPTPENPVRSKPRSRAESVARFPSILMPAAIEAEQKQELETNNRKPIALIILLVLALCACAAYFASQSFAPQISQSVPADTAVGTAFPAPSTNDSARATNPTILLPRLGTDPQIPQAAAINVPARAIKSADDAPNALRANALWQNVSLPVMPTAPSKDPLFALPDVSELTISLIVPNQASASKVRAISTVLQDTGFEISEPRQVTYKVSTTQVRFFHEQDAKPAEKLAGAIDGVARDFTDYVPKPQIGLVEVFIESKAAPVASNPAQPRGFGADLRQFGTDIRNTLQGLTR